MANKLVSGVEHALLTDANKFVCEFCNGSSFQVGWQCDENTDLRVDSKAYLMENSAPTLPYGNVQTAVFLCNSCGRESGKVVWLLDVCSVCATPVVTATHIACVTTVNNLAGLYLTPLGGGTVGVPNLIVSNTVADPTVITLTDALNNNTATEVILISSFKPF